MVMNIVYSTVVACLVEVFLIANVSMISSYLRETRYRDSFFLRLTETETLMAFVYLLSGIAIFSVTFIALQERSMRYISRISSAIQNISEGDLNTAIEVRGDDEFTAMAVNLNKMVGDIRNLMDKEREAERTKNELITNVAHDLRTPLTSISGFAEIMKNGMVPPADMGKFAEKIYNEAQRLIALVQDIIKLSKLDEKDTSLCEEEVELDALVQEACERLQPAAERKRVTLSAETEPILFRGVKQVLSEMIYNLCDNAIRYNKEGGAVFVTLKQKADRISLTVRDTGIGIAKEEQGRIFERFYRVDASRSAENGGTGLGLSIVNHGAALHNGKIFIESEIGNGTSIEISMPNSIN